MIKDGWEASNLIFPLIGPKKWKGFTHVDSHMFLFFTMVALDLSLSVVLDGLC